MLRSVACTALVVCSALCGAQAPLRAVTAPVVAGSEGEQYLRVLQLTGKVAAGQWTVRGFGPRELKALQPTDTMHPRPSGQEATRRVGALRWGFGPVESQVVLNTGYAYGYNDYAVWAGRGLTASISPSVYGSAGPLSVVVAPLAFVSQNAPFAMRATGFPGRLEYADGTFPQNIDLPQRFGSGVYGAVDPGQSAIRLDTRGVAVGFTTANEVWGPAIENPLLLGTNAAGFPHVFLGTSRPRRLGWVTVQTRMIWGTLSQSDYAISEGRDARRFASGMVGTISPRGLLGLELGAGRFFHLPWRGAPSLDYLLRPFQGIIKARLATDANEQGDDPEDNQLASVFFRWALPGHGFEAYGEFGREDHNWNTRDLIGQPDHDAAYTLGLQRAWTREPRSIVVFRGEVMNAAKSHLGQSIIQTAWYMHAGGTLQGHTQEGQILGAPGAFGGGATLAELERITPEGTTGVAYRRILRWQLPTQRVASPDSAEMQQVVTLTRTLRHGPGELTWKGSGVWAVNRNLAGGTAFNLNVVVQYRLYPRR